MESRPVGLICYTQTQVGVVGFRNRRARKRSVVLLLSLHRRSHVAIWFDVIITFIPSHSFSLFTFQRWLSLAFSNSPQISRLGFLSQTLPTSNQVPILPWNLRSTFPYSPSTHDPSNPIFSSLISPFRIRYDLFSDLNWWHEDFQSSALPTDLSRPFLTHKTHFYLPCFAS